MLVSMLARFEIWEGSISDLMCALSRGNIVYVKREYECVFLEIMQHDFNSSS